MTFTFSWEDISSFIFASCWSAVRFEIAKLRWNNSYIHSMRSKIHTSSSFFTLVIFTVKHLAVKFLYLQKGSYGRHIGLIVRPILESSGFSHYALLFMVYLSLFLAETRPTPRPDCLQSNSIDWRVRKIAIGIRVARETTLKISPLALNESSSLRTEYSTA